MLLPLRGLCGPAVLHLQLMIRATHHTGARGHEASVVLKCAQRPCSNKSKALLQICCASYRHYNTLLSLLTDGELLLLATLRDMQLM